MAMLNFKHGLYANLPAQKSNGTIYVTTDEKAMYVDLNNERIRLSQIITCTYEQWQNLQPPYSTEAFYYVIDKNALLKYNDGSKAPEGADQSLVSGWVQINSTAALESSLNSLTNRVDALDGENGRVKALETQANGLASRLDELDTAETGKIALIEKDIADLKQEDIDLAKEIEDVKEDLKSVASSGTVTDLGNRVNVLENALSDGNNGYLDVSDIKSTADDAKALAEAALPTATFTAFQTTNNEAIAKAQSDAEATAAAALQAHSDAQTITINGLQESIKGLIEADKGFVKADGSVEMSGNLDLDSHKIINLAAPEADNDAARKKYVDDAVKGASEAAKAADDKAVAAGNAAAAADEKAVAAGNLAQQAYELADAAVTTGELADAIKDFATDNEVAEAVAAAKTAVLGEENYSQTVKSAWTLADAANTLAGAADEKAGKAQQAADDITEYVGEFTHASATTVVEYIDEKTKGIATSGALEALDDRVKAVEAATTTTLPGLIDDAQRAAEEALAEAEKKTTMADVEAKGYATVAYVDGQDKKIAGTNEDGSLYVDQTVKSTYAKAEENATAIAKNAENIDKLRGDVEKNMQAADAMTFEGGVATEAELLAKTNVNKGDTYKATAEFELNGENVFIGDLLIATGDEAEDGVIADPTWVRVPAGYRAEYVPSLDIVNESADENGLDADKSVAIKLTSAHAEDNKYGDLGVVNFTVESGSALTIKADNTVVDESGARSGSITIGMAWGSF